MVFKTIFQGAATYASFLGPSSQTLLFPMMTNEHIGASIPLLLFRGNPSAITGRVIAEIIDAIQRSSFWSFSHISKKISKLLPTLANGNPPAAITSVVWRCRFGAAIFHQRPRIVGWRAVVIFAAAPMTVNGICVRFHNFIVSHKLFEETAA